MSRHDTAGIVGDGLPEADWKETQRIAQERFQERQRKELEERESREAGKTIPEWKKYDKER